MLNAIANSDVPIITIIAGASFGAGNFAMSGRSLKPRFIFSYPNSKMAVMEPDQLAGVLEMIGYDKNNPGKNTKEKLLKETEKQSSAFYASGQLWDDGIIDPRQTRNYLAICLAAVNCQKQKENNSYGVFRM